VDPFLGFGYQIATGVMMTVRVALGALALGLLWGIIGAIAKLSAFRLPRLVADAYTTAARGTPELLVILIAYFGSTVTLTKLAKLWNPETVYIEIPAMGAGIFALSLVFGAYVTEVFRGAILAVPVGQVEAAKAFGMPSWMIFVRIKLPQMYRFALPGLGNHWISLVKDTALISVVGLEELMRMSYIATSVTNRPFRFYFIATLIYLLIAMINTSVLQRLERRAKRGVREG